MGKIKEMLEEEQANLQDLDLDALFAYYNQQSKVTVEEIRANRMAIEAFMAFGGSYD